MKSFISSTNDQNKLIHWFFLCVACHNVGVSPNLTNKSLKSLVPTFEREKAKIECKVMYQQELEKDVDSWHPYENMQDKLIPDIEKVVSMNIANENKTKLIYQNFEAYTMEQIQQLRMSLGKTFSVSPKVLSKQMATDFIKYMIDHCIENSIEMKKEMVELLKDEQGANMTIACIKNRKCIISGKDGADIHHVESYISRKYKPDYEGDLLVLPLHREYHNLAHSKGNQWLIDTYHLEPVPYKLALGTYTQDEINKEIAEHKNPKNNSDYRRKNNEL